MSDAVRGRSTSSPTGSKDLTDDVAERLRRIESITDVSFSHLDLDAFLTELLERVRDVLDADTAAILLVDESGEQLVATAALGLEDAVRERIRIPVGQGFAGRIAAERSPVLIERVDHTNVLNPILREKGVRSLLGVPLLAGGNVIGVLHVGTLSERAFTSEDTALLSLVADRVALATQATTSTAERSAARALQRSLVPARLPQIQGLDIAARYVPSEGGAVGGDWYDVFTLPGGAVGVVVGDVVGRGLRAAVVMGRLRSALRAYALETRDPAQILTRLDRKLSHFEPGEMATVLCAIVDPSLEHVHLSCAGHLPPAVAHPETPSLLVDVLSDPPIGVHHRQRRSMLLDLPPGSSLCLFTDGLVERRGEPLDVGLERLRAALHADRADAACRRLMATLLDPETEDDVALLVVRRPFEADVTPLELAVPARPASLTSIRAAVRRWLARIGATPTASNDLLVAIGEACSNAVEHAYGPSGGIVRVRLEQDPPMMIATVSDRGTWRPPRGVNRGRGTALMRALADDVHIDHTAAGTTVTLRVRIDKEPAG